MAPVAEVKAKFSAYIDETVHGPVVVTRNGRPAAVLVRMDDEEELERFILAHSPKFRAILDAADERYRRGESLSSDEFWAKVDAASKPKRRRAADLAGNDPIREAKKRTQAKRRRTA